MSVVSWLAGSCVADEGTAQGDDVVNGFAVQCVSGRCERHVDVDAVGGVDASLDEPRTSRQPPNDQGFLYGRSFTDPDGHQWDAFHIACPPHPKPSISPGRRELSTAL